MRTRKNIVRIKKHENMIDPRFIVSPMDEFFFFLIQSVQEGF